MRASWGVITGSGASGVGLTLPVQQVTYASIEKATGKLNAFKGDGGWLGFTDKYWGSAVIPDQTAPIRSEIFGHRGRFSRFDYQADFLGKEQTVAPGASFETKTRVFAGRERGQHDRRLRGPVSASRSFL